MRMLKFIGAETVLAVDISAITGSFADLNVTGRLSASHIDADVQNVGVIWLGSRSINQNTAYGFKVGRSGSLNKFDVIQIGMSSNSLHAASSMPVSRIPNSMSFARDNNVSIEWRISKQVVNGDDYIGVKADDGGELGTLYSIIGIKNPSSAAFNAPINLST